MDGHENSNSFLKCVDRLARIFVLKGRQSPEGKKRNGRVPLISEEKKLKIKIFKAFYDHKLLAKHRKDSYYWRLLAGHSNNVKLVLEMLRFNTNHDLDAQLEACGLDENETTRSVLHLLLCLTSQSKDNSTDQLSVMHSNTLKKETPDYPQFLFRHSKYHNPKVDCSWSQLKTFRLSSLLPANQGRHVKEHSPNMRRSIHPATSIDRNNTPDFYYSEIFDSHDVHIDEDEGFVSGRSSPCSERILQNTISCSEALIRPYYDYRPPDYYLSGWEKCLSTKRQTYYNWDLNRENVYNKEWYLSEAGSAAYDVVWKSRLHLIEDLARFFEPSTAINKLTIVDESVLLSHACLVVVGIASDTFHFNKLALMFLIPGKLSIHGVTPSSVRNCLQQFAEWGTCYKRLTLFTTTVLRSTAYVNTWSQRTECILMTYCEAVQHYLHYFQEHVLKYTNQCKSLQQLSLSLQQPAALINYICQLCKCGSPDAPLSPVPPGESDAAFPTGVSLLTYLYEEALHSTEPNERFMLLFLLQKCCQPYLNFVQSWVFRGLCAEPSDEFMITINENNGNKRDRRRWKNYIVAKNPADIKSCVPLFLAPIAEKIFICGKSIELMHFICPQHFLCTEMIRLPHLRMSYSKVEMRRQMVEWGEFQSLLQHQENDINLYWEKEEQTRVREKEELISSSLEQFHSQLEKMAAERRQNEMRINEYKKSEYDRLKKQAEEDANRRKLNKRNEALDDLRLLEKGEYGNLFHKETADNSKLMAQAKEEMVQHYAKLTKDVESREARAIWRIKRHNLNEKRVLFLQEQAIPDPFTRPSTSISEDKRKNEHSTDTKLEPDEGASEKQLSSNHSNTENAINPPNVDTTESQPHTTVQMDVKTTAGQISSGIKEMEIKSKPTKELQVHHSQSSIQHLMYYGKKEAARAKNSEPSNAIRGNENQNLVGQHGQDFQLVLGGCDTYDEHIHSIYQVFNRNLGKDERVDRCTKLFPTQGTNKQGEPFGGSKDIVTADLDALPVMLLKCVLHPISVHSDLVNRCVVQHFMKNLGMMKHFEMLRHFLLLEDGEFGQTFSNSLFHIIHGANNPSDSLNSMALDSILSRSVQSSNFRDSPLIGNLYLSVKQIPPAFDPLDKECLNFFELRYSTPWPCNIVITESSHSKYNLVLKFLLQLKHLIWVLHDVRTQLCRIESGVFPMFKLNASELRFLQIYRHEMHNFVKIIQGYVSTQVLHVCWKEFLDALQHNVTNLEDIYCRHAEYVHKCVLRCLLTPKAQAVLNLILDALKCILRFHLQLRTPKSCSFRSLKHSYLEFARISNFLYRVVVKLVEKGYQPHLENFLVRLNFNGFYKT